MPINRDTLAPEQYHLAGSLALVAEPFCFVGSCFEKWSWQDVGLWYANLVESRYDHKGWDESVPPADYEQALRTMRQVFDRVRDSTRYVSMSIGASGWRPRREQDILATGYGDCKDLASILVSELRRQGITAWPALILTVDEGYTDTTFPAFSFNHAIAAAILAEDTIWMDPTCEHCCFGSLPYTDQNTHALLVTDDGGHLVRTPEDSASDNLTERYAKITILEDRRMSIEGRIVTTGQYANRLRSLLPQMKQDERARLVENYLGGSAGECSVGHVDIQGLADRCAPLTLGFAATSKRPLKLIGNVLYLDPITFPCGLGYTAEDTVGYRYDLPISYARRYHDRVAVVLGSGFAVDSLGIPAAIQESHPFGGLDFSCERFDDSVIVTLEHAFSSYEIHPEDFAAYLTFQNRLEGHEGFRIKCFPNGKR